MLDENIDPRLTQISPNSQSADFLPVVPSTSGFTAEACQREKSSFSGSGANRMAPLYGKKIFMHYDPGTSSDKYLESVLRKLKADLVDFFSRDIHYVISNRPQSRIPSLSPSLTPTHNGSSNASLPKQPVSSAGRLTNVPSSMALKTPFLPTAKTASAAVTRGRAMLMAARKSTGSLNTTSPQEPKPSEVLRQLQPTNTNSSAVATKTPDGGPSNLRAQELTETSAAALWSPSNDLLVRARRLGIRILTVEAVFKWIRNLPSDVQAYIQSAEGADSDKSIADIPDDPERDRVCQVRHLTTPCIKILDISGQTRPLYMDRTDYLPDLWNLLSHRPAKTKESLCELSTNAGSGSVPAASLGRTGAPASQSHPATAATGTPSILSRQTSRMKRKQRLTKHHTSVKLAHSLKRSTSISGKIGCPSDTRTKPAVEDEPSGYCECCSMTFPNLFEHLKCPEHQQFAKNSENYHLLDDVLNRLPSLQSFLTSETIKQKSIDAGDRRPTAHRKRHQSASKSSACDAQVSQKTQDNLDEPAAHGVPVTTVSLDVAAVDESPVKPMVPPCLKSVDPAEQGHAEPVDQLKLFSDDEADHDDEALVKAVTKDAVGLKSSTPLPLEVPAVTTLEQNLAVEEPSPGPVRIISFSVDLDEGQKGFPAAFVDPIPQQPDFPATSTVNAWHSVCAEIYVSESFRQPVSRSDSNCTMNVSPVLERFHIPCSVCCRSHIPSRLPDSMHLKMNSLLGPSLQLDGFGCQRTSFSPDGMLSPTAIPSSQDERSTPEETPAVSALLEAQDDHNAGLSPIQSVHSASCSPVFDSKDTETTHRPQNCTPPTSPMRRLSTGSTKQPDQPHAVISNSTRSNQPSLSETTPSSSPPFSRPIISTPLVSPHTDSSTLSTSRCVLPPNSPSSKSDAGKRRKSLNWLLNTASFEAQLPCDAHASSGSELQRIRKRGTNKRRCLTSNLGYDTEGAVLRQLPVLKRTKLGTENPITPRSKRENKFSMGTAPGTGVDKLPHSDRKRKRKRKASGTPPPYATPSRGVLPRVAARIARESISLSVRALYSPSTLDRFSDERHQPVPPASLSLHSVAISSPSEHKSCPQRKKSGRILFSPNSPCADPSDDEFFDSPVPKSRGSAKSILYSPKMRLFGGSSDGNHVDQLISAVTRQLLLV
ncbi:DBF zinc finger [Opisthorchis viverrini]|uniref:DBF zinc finger n=1 Tax=Opisthorchis viverrini TaxID=6198 RepID=A0A1S8X8D1_OPIVI|nr:DBF zinc finger [Opisthorchis viverrini]